MPSGPLFSARADLVGVEDLLDFGRVGRARHHQPTGARFHPRGHCEKTAMTAIRSRYDSDTTPISVQQDHEKLADQGGEDTERSRRQRELCAGPVRLWGGMQSYAYRAYKDASETAPIRQRMPPNA
ncbi:MAG: hypothetical protein JWN15_1939 [Firmicutes bacterium]|nr:hypothetical protein [Bacillota bacterium]